MPGRRLMLALPLLWLRPGRVAARDLIDDAVAAFDDLPVPDCRVRPVLRALLAGEACSLLAFGADLPDGRRDLLAVAAGGRLLALELLGWHADGGARLATRVAVVPDHRRLRLEREAAAPRGRGIRREQWTDYLAWQEAAPMVDAPVRPVLAGTWQAGLAAQRAGVRTLLAPGLRGVSAALLAACPSPAAVFA